MITNSNEESTDLSLAPEITKVLAEQLAKHKKSKANEATAKQLISKLKNPKLERLAFRASSVEMKKIQFIIVFF